MGKRGAENQISKETYDEDNDNEVEAGTFRQATEATISKRKIIAPRSRLNGAIKLPASGGGEAKPVASPFGTFTFGTTASAAKSTTADAKIPAPSDSVKPNSSAAASLFGSFAFASVQKSNQVNAAPFSATENSNPAVSSSATEPISEQTPRNPFASFAFGTAKPSAPSVTLSSQVAPTTSNTNIGSMNTGFSSNSSPSKNLGLSSSTPLWSTGQSKATTFDTNLSSVTPVTSSSTAFPIQAQTAATATSSSTGNIEPVCTPTYPPKGNEAEGPGTKRIRIVDRLGTKADDSQEQRELSELYAFLAALNRTLMAHLSKVVSDYPICDMANVLEDYQKTRDEIINVKCASAARKVGLTSTLPACVSGTSWNAAHAKSTVDPIPNKTPPAIMGPPLSVSSKNAIPTFIGTANWKNSAQSADSSNDVTMESDDMRQNVSAFGTGNANLPLGSAFGKSADIMKHGDVKSGTEQGTMEVGNGKEKDSLNFTNTSNLVTSETTSTNYTPVPNPSLGSANVKPGIFSFPKPSSAGDTAAKSMATGTQGFSLGGNATAVQGFAFPKGPNKDNNNEVAKPFGANFGFPKTEGSALDKNDDITKNNVTSIPEPQPPVSNTTPKFTFASTTNENSTKGEAPKPFIGFGSFGSSPSSGISTEGQSVQGFGKTTSFGATGFSFGASAATTGESINKSLLSAAGGEAKDQSGEDDVPPGEEDSFQQNRTNDELIRKGAGEEDEESLHEVRCKVYKPAEGGKPTDLGTGLLKVNRNTKTNSRRLLCRQEGSGKVILNAPLFVNMTIQEKGPRGIGYPVFDAAAATWGIWFVRVGTPESAKYLRELIGAQVVLMKEEKEAANSKN